MVAAVVRENVGQAPSPEELIARAKAMIPALKSRARQCVADRNVPAETIEELRKNGFFRILQPKRFGGYEMEPNVFFEVQKALAQGCMSTGWMYGVVGCHPFEIALFHDKAQQEVWGEDADTLASSSYQPVGKVTHVDGGFRLSGRWGFSTGSAHCQWVLLGAFVPRRAKATQWKCAPSCSRAATTRSTSTRGTPSVFRARAVMTSSSTMSSFPIIVPIAAATVSTARTPGRR
ncbi:acyl-CoA dehydrogenase family protein [Novosphingobium panipatense]